MIEKILGEGVESYTFFLTGSRAFGCAKEDSDWDYVFPVWDKEDILIILEKKKILPVNSHYNAGIAFEYKYTKYNFIFLHSSDFVCWARAAILLRTNAVYPSFIKEKIKRYAVHEMLCGIIKASLPYEINSKNWKQYMPPIADDGTLPIRIKE